MKNAPTLFQPIAITITVMLIALAIGIPVWHYATALLLSATWRYKHLSLFEPLDFSPKATPMPVLQNMPHGTD